MHCNVLSVSTVATKGSLCVAEVRGVKFYMDGITAAQSTAVLCPAWWVPVAKKGEVPNMTLDVRQLKELCKWQSSFLGKLQEAVIDIKHFSLVPRTDMLGHHSIALLRDAAAFGDAEVNGPAERALPDAAVAMINPKSQKAKTPKAKGKNAKAKCKAGSKPVLNKLAKHILT